MNKSRNRTVSIIIVVLFVSCGIILNKEVSIQQGRDSRLYKIKMPLYMKIMDFLTRGNRYVLLVKRIVKDCKTDSEKLEALFNWTATNIRPVPDGFPIVDDHVDNIIIRGYGTDDQSADVFTTLAAFAGFKSGMYLTRIYPENYLHAVSLVELNERMLLFDTYYKFYFLNHDKEIASLDEIREDINLVKIVAGDFKVKDKYSYIRFFQHLEPVEKLGWSKADLQMPSKRLIYVIGLILGITEESRVFYGIRYRTVQNYQGPVRRMIEWKKL